MVCRVRLLPPRAQTRREARLLLLHELVLLLHLLIQPRRPPLTIPVRLVLLQHSLFILSPLESAPGIGEGPNLLRGVLLLGTRLALVEEVEQLLLLLLLVVARRDQVHGDVGI